MTIAAFAPEVICPIELSQIRSDLLGLLEAANTIAMPDDDRLRAMDVIAHLIELEAMRRLTAPFLKLALDSLRDDRLCSWLEPLSRRVSIHLSDGGGMGGPELA